MVFIKDNLKNYLKPIEKELLIDVERYKHLRDINFSVETKHKDFIYNTFINICRERLNNFTLIDTDFKLWCFYTEKSWVDGGRVIEEKSTKIPFHNHLHTTTINSVLYLKSPKGCGLDIEYENKTEFLKMKDYDIIIFPNWLNHRPVISNTKSRISFNLELRCKEDVNDIFRYYK